MSDDLEQLKRHPSAIRLFTERVRLKKDGKEMIGLCCFHSEKSPSLRVFERDGILLFKCFGCGKTGNVIQFVSEHDKIPFNAALKKCREFLNQSWESTREKVEATFKPFAEETKTATKTISLSQYAQFEQALERNDAAQQFLLKERGISYETARKLRLGYRHDIGSIGGDALADVRDRGWIAFPRIIGDCVGGIHYRSLARKAFARQPGMGTYLFGLQEIDLLEPIYVTEGEFDACVLSQIGLRAVSVPNATTNLSPEMKDALLEAECVILAGDNDNGPGTKLMEKLWTELQERTYLLRWPDNCKDANAFWDHCKRDLSVFRTRVNSLTTEAKSRPMSHVYSLPEMMVSRAEENIADHPNRFRFPWPSVDQMALLAPGSVIGVVATNTGQGKSTWVLQATLHAAWKHNETVVNYQAELTQEQVARIVTAHVLRKHRLQLSKEDFNEAAGLLKGIKYYVGRNPVLNTIEPVLDLIEAACRRLGATVVVLDNLHFLCRFEADQVKAVENAMQRIKNLSARHGLKFFVIGQPKKADSKSKGKSLHITDVRGSASFGDDSDAVYTIHRDVIGDREMDKKNEYDPKTKVRLVKVRDKGMGDAEVDLIFLGEIATFAEVSYAEQAAAMFG